MKHFQPLVLLLPMLLSCSENETSTETADSERYECIIPPPDSTPKIENATPEVIKECYRYDKDDEHHWIEINSLEDSAWGNLTWYIEGKDGVKGAYTGKFNGDTLWIMHQAVMEGHLVPREVAFLKKDDKLYEAQDFQEEDAKGTYRYQYKKMLAYSDPKPMVKVQCK